MARHSQEKTVPERILNNPTARRVGKKAVACGLIVTGAFYAYDNYLPHFRFGGPDHRNQIAQKVVKVAPLAIACREYMEADIKGFLHSKLENIKGTGYESDLHGFYVGKDGKRHTTKYGRTQTLGCMPNPDVRILPDPQTGHTEVIVNLERFKPFTRIDESATEVTNPKPPISAMGDGIGNVIGGVSEVVTLGKFNADPFAGTDQEHEAQLNQINREMNVDRVDTSCQTEAFGAIEQAIIKSYHQEYGSLVDVSFSGTPTFDKTYDPLAHYNSVYKLSQKDIKEPRCSVSPTALDIKLGDYYAVPQSFQAEAGSR